ncbi:STAS/SEC14 domain-containing protein [Nitrosomonas aestuarii]|uniref:STAS/SEC14 domain-containing protein n=1 Tax=Nitrosomonas aestuarii TaxID=52441 RepID=UPI000D2FBB65|nr:STAS/SEC14 domain-containing protein [Nitrosomonas aestuarii]PTN11623.1 SpoIIAA-like protein [Nitrosomonas aestuarii]
MITIQKQNNLIIVAVIGEFTLSDYKQFEDQVIYQSTFEGKVNVVVDFRDMLNYTVDVAWEDLKFMHEHGNDFSHVAVVTDDEWQTWSAWISNLFTDAQVIVFNDYEKAVTWAASGDISPSV